MNVGANLLRRMGGPRLKLFFGGGLGVHRAETRMTFATRCEPRAAGGCDGQPDTVNHRQFAWSGPRWQLAGGGRRTGEIVSLTASDVVVRAEGQTQTFPLTQVSRVERRSHHVRNGAGINRATGDSRVLFSTDGSAVPTTPRISPSRPSIGISLRF